MQIQHLKLQISEIIWTCCADLAICWSAG